MLCLIGCSNTMPPNPTTVAAKGKATLPTGEPLANVRVVFVPKTPGGKEVEAFADTDGSGQFAVTTYQTGDGIVPGEYKVTVDPLNYRHKGGSPVMNAAMASRVPKKYTDGSSDVFVKVEAEKQLDIQLNR